MAAQKACCGFLQHSASLVFGYTRFHLGSDQCNHGALVLVTRQLRVKSTFLRGFLTVAFDLFFPAQILLLILGLQPTITWSKAQFSNLKATTSHMTSSFMIQTRITSTHERGSLAKAAYSTLNPEMGTSITVGHLLGQRSFLACKGADAVMFCFSLVHYN